jgi:hypothetical protein
MRNGFQFAVDSVGAVTNRIRWVCWSVPRPFILHSSASTMSTNCNVLGCKAGPFKDAPTARKHRYQYHSTPTAFPFEGEQYTVTHSDDRYSCPLPNCDSEFKNREGIQKHLEGKHKVDRSMVFQPVVGKHSVPVVASGALIAVCLQVQRLLMAPTDGCWCQQLLQLFSPWVRVASPMCCFTTNDLIVSANILPTEDTDVAHGRVLVPGTPFPPGTVPMGECAAMSMSLYH